MLQSSATRRAVLALMIAAGGTYHTVTVGLYQSNIPFDPLNTIAPFTAAAATFTGYGISSAIVWGGIVDAPDGSAYCMGDLKQFVCDDSAHPQDIFGDYWISAGALVNQEIFQTQLPARAAFDFFNVQPLLQY